ncbi:MAG: DMT family transporter [Treponema sp.]|jgi:drug/metabolite transporter (DMT)-like permease|nr:DMT family transporter [Treponema sp.]
MNRRAFRADLLLLLTALLWGFGFVAQSSAMDHVGPFTYNAIRFALGSLSLLPLIAFQKRRAPAAAGKKKTLRASLAAGSVLFTAVAFQQIGMLFTTVGNAGFITGFYVVLTPIFAVTLGKKTRWSTWLGMALALSGLYFISVAGHALSINPGDVLILISSVFWAVHILLIDSLVKRTNPITLSAGQFAWCGLFALIAAFALEPHVATLAARFLPGRTLQRWVTPAELAAAIGGLNGGGALLVLRDAAVSILYGGFVSVGIAYTLQVVAQKDALPAHAAILLCLEGAFAAMGGVLLRNESLRSTTLIGFCFMLAGMIVTQLEVIRGQEPTPTPPSRD